MNDLTIITGDCRKTLAQVADGTVDCAVTSPPYWGQRDYGVDGQIGHEATPREFVDTMVSLFGEVRRALKDEGTLWLNLGDCYNAYNGGAGPSSKLSRQQSAQRPKLATGYGLRDKSLKPKDLIGIPWMVAFALREDGWYLRADHVWGKPNGMPESVGDRTTRAHEYVFLLAKSEEYWIDMQAVRTAPKASTETRLAAKTTGPDDSPSKAKPIDWDEGIRHSMRTTSISIQRN